MSVLGGSTKKTAAGEAAPDTPALTPEQIVEQLRVLRERIPEFVQLPNDHQTRHMRRIATVNVEFAREAFNTVSASELVETALGNTAEELHAADAENARWTAVETELRAMLRGVNAANLVRRQRIAHAALQAFNVSSQLVKLQEHANLLPHVERMRQLPKFGRRRTRAAVEPQPQATAPAKPV